MGSGAGATGLLLTVRARLGDLGPAANAYKPVIWRNYDRKKCGDPGLLRNACHGIALGSKERTPTEPSGGVCASSQLLVDEGCQLALLMAPTLVAASWPF